MTPPEPAYYAFDRVANEYEQTRPMPPEIAEGIARRVLADVKDDDWFLDAGVGTGRVARALAARHARTLGADISLPMLHMMERHISPGERLPVRVRADVRHLPFADGAFAGVLVVHVLHLIADWERALSEMRRVVRPGGTLWLGEEKREASLVREIYLEAARAAGLIHTSLDRRRDVVPVLRGWGDDVQTHEYTELTWTRHIPVAESLDNLKRRTFSVLWEIPDDAHERLMAHTAQTVASHFGGTNAVEEIAIRVQLVASRKAI